MRTHQSDRIRSGSVPPVPPILAASAPPHQRRASLERSLLLMCAAWIAPPTSPDTTPEIREEGWSFGIGRGSPWLTQAGRGLAYSGLGAVTLSPIAAATLYISGQSGWLPTGRESPWLQARAGGSPLAYLGRTYSLPDLAVTHCAKIELLNCWKRLITSSNLMARSSGRSPGLAPLRMRPVCRPARR
jgi:hypothetical protein